MFDKTKIAIEAWHYARYAVMNTKRKNKVPANKIFKTIDALRRKIGFVK